MLSNDGGSPNTVLDIASGMAMDSTNKALMQSLTAFAKSISGSWVAGSGANGMGQGLTATASTWYHVFLILSGGIADFYFDTSVTAANVPAGIQFFRRIGSILLNGSTQITAFAQIEDTVFWNATVYDVNAAFTSARSLTVLTVPPGVSVRPLIRWREGGNSTMILSPAEPDNAPLASGSWASAPGNDASINSVVVRDPWIYTNTSAQVAIRANAAATTVQLVTRGYVDTRGKYV